MVAVVVEMEIKVGRRPRVVQQMRSKRISVLEAAEERMFRAQFSLETVFKTTLSHRVGFSSEKFPRFSPVFTPTPSSDLPTIPYKIQLLEFLMQ